LRNQCVTARPVTDDLKLKVWMSREESRRRGDAHVDPLALSQTGDHGNRLDPRPPRPLWKQREIDSIGDDIKARRG
jgi:hypothetical protein